jgi:polysaccharide pyruvyl transferase WcaK-like protein
MDFVTGTRIHGNILALQSEVPAIPIVHDSRTTGLCKTLKIPFTDLNQTQEWLSPSQVISQLNIWKKLSEKKLDYHRCQLADKYLNHLLSMNLKPSQHLLHLASGFSQDMEIEKTSDI